MFEDLTGKFERAFKFVLGKGKVNEQEVDRFLREVRKVLLDADVNYKVAKDFVDEVKTLVVSRDVYSSINPGKLIIAAINERLAALMGEKRTEIKFSDSIPSVIMLVGLQGSGKTTFAAKLANYLRTRGRQPALAACDIYRPAAVEQLRTLGEQIGIPVFSGEPVIPLTPFKGGKPLTLPPRRDFENSTFPAFGGVNSGGAEKIALDAMEFCRKNMKDTLIVDTAGRLAINDEMMREVEAMKERLEPAEILFIVDSMTGQDAVNTSKEFHNRLDFDGVVLTKLDGDTRGGAALSIRAVVNKPIKFVSVGEKLDAIEPFYPDRMASRIMGKGDLASLAEKAAELSVSAGLDEKKIKKLEEKLRKNKFDFIDFLEQLQQIKKMGSFSQMIGMIPGADKLLKGKEIDEKPIKKTEAVILSMTLKEREQPEILNGSRRRRIASGSGTSIQEVNKLIKQFYEMRKMMKQMSSGKFSNVFKNLQPT